MILTSAAPARPGSLAACELVVGCVTDGGPKYVAQALRLVQSIRWLGGEMAEAAIVVCAVGELAASARRSFAAHGAEVRAVRPFDARNPFANKLQFFDEALGCGREMLLLLDCDTLVVRDPLPLMRRGVVQAKIAPLPTVTPEVFARLFDHFGLPLPPAEHVNAFAGTPTIRYCNSGVILAPAELARRFVPVWRDYNERLAADLAILHPCERYCNQASLSLALAACPVPFAEAPVELNYQLNMSDREPPPGFLAVDPAILHYHDGVDAEGYLLPSPYPLAQARLEAFNRRLREEREGKPGRAAHRAPPAADREAAQVVVLGMHRSGTSAVAGLLNLMGCWAGLESAFPPADDDNPKGYWEHRDVWALDEALLRSLGGSWCDAGGVDLARLAAPLRERFAERARGIARELGPGPWVIKDPRLCLLFPLWRDVLERPVCVLVHRDPVATALSLEKRDGLPLPHGIALWELYNRAALTATLGLPRLLVSFRDLIAEPAAAVRRLHRELLRLTGPDAAGLSVPPVEEIHAFLDPTLDRHPPDPRLDHGYLNLAQLELQRALDGGTALDLDPVPPLSTLARDLLAGDALVESAARRSRMGTDLHRAERWIEELDHLLGATYASRSWRLGHALTGLARRLLRRPAPGSPGAPSAADRRDRLMEEIRAWRARR